MKTTTNLTRDEFLAAVSPMADPPYAPDWEVVSAERISDAVYHYRVTGINHNYDEGHPSRNFCWSVPTLNWRFFWPESVRAA